MVFNKAEKFDKLKGLGEKNLDLVNKGVNGLKKTLDRIQEGNLKDVFDRNFYGFISLNRGCGVKTVACQVAYELSRSYRVCVIDCDLLMPGMGVLFNTPVTEDMSVMRYFNSNKEIADTFIEVKGVRNLWLISASPLDDPVEVAGISEESFNELFRYIKDTFDYVIASIPYFPFGEWFVCTLPFIDRGYFVWDEQVDNALNTKGVLRYINKISDKANSVNNIILNKRTSMAYPYNKIEEAECTLVTEIPFSFDVMRAKNEGRIYVAKGADEGYMDGINVLIRDIKSGQEINRA